MPATSTSAHDPATASHAIAVGECQLSENSAPVAVNGGLQDFRNVLMLDFYEDGVGSNGKTAVELAIALNADDILPPRLEPKYAGGPLESAPEPVACH